MGERDSERERLRETDRQTDREKVTILFILITGPSVLRKCENVLFP